MDRLGEGVGLGGIMEHQQPVDIERLGAKAGPDDTSIAVDKDLLGRNLEQADHVDRTIQGHLLGGGTGGRRGL